MTAQGPPVPTVSIDKFKRSTNVVPYHYVFNYLVGPFDRPGLNPSNSLRFNQPAREALAGHEKFATVDPFDLAISQRSNSLGLDPFKFR